MRKLIFLIPTQGLTKEEIVERLNKILSNKLGPIKRSETSFVKKVKEKVKGNYINPADLPGVFFLLIALTLLFLYTRVDFLGSNYKQNPIPTPQQETKVPMETLDLRDTSWNGNNFSGKITNNNQRDVFDVVVKLSVSKNANNWEPEDQLVTIPYKISAGETFNFYESASQAQYNSWWSSQVVSAKYYNGEVLPTPTPTPAPTYIPVAQQNYGNNDPWGIAKQISEHTWTIKVGMDERMATPQEIYDALNAYRERKGVGHLDWSGELATYAQSRADFFNKEGKLDEHKGFNDYTQNPDNLRTLGHWWVGENSSVGYRLLGVHLIEWVFAGDKPHDDNQRSPNWRYVGVGVSGTGVDLIFGAN